MAGLAGKWATVEELVMIVFLCRQRNLSPQSWLLWVKTIMTTFRLAKGVHEGRHTLYWWYLETRKRGREIAIPHSTNDGRWTTFTMRFNDFGWEDLATERSETSIFQMTSQVMVYGKDCECSGFKRIYWLTTRSLPRIWDWRNRPLWCGYIVHTYMFCIFLGY